MKKINLTLAAGIVATAILFTGCAKNGATGPAGAQGPAGVVPTSSDGYIKGTATGNRMDGTAFTYPFSWSNYWGSFSGQVDSVMPNMYSYAIQRSADIFGTNSASINISVTSYTATTGTVSLNLNFMESIGNNKEFSFSSSGNNFTGTASGISYNRTNGLCTGSYTASAFGTGNSTGHAANITSGSFSATMTQLVYHNEQATKGVSNK
ncbi:MAG: hypothetical protein ACYDCN_14260 [Bacteroidia bacterium]